MSFCSTVWRKAKIYMSNCANDEERKSNRKRWQVNFFTCSFLVFFLFGRYYFHPWIFLGEYVRIRVRVSSFGIFFAYFGRNWLKREQIYVYFSRQLLSVWFYFLCAFIFLILISTFVSFAIDANIKVRFLLLFFLIMNILRICRHKNGWRNLYFRSFLVFQSSVVHAQTKD